MVFSQILNSGKTWMELLKSLKIPKRLNFQRIRVTWVIFLKAYELWVKFQGARELWVKFQNFSLLSLLPFSAMATRDPCEVVKRRSSRLLATAEAALLVPAGDGGASAYSLQRRRPLSRLQLRPVRQMKTLVWFWIIDETYVY